MRQALLEGLPELGLTLTGEQADALCAFGDALLKKNRVMNLTAITDPAAVARLHFLDCLALLNTFDFQGKTVVDVGCGAGFPGVPLKVAVPSMDMTLLDSLNKRMDWLREVLPSLGIGANCVTARAEEYALRHREQYDAAVSRAVARLHVLAELCLPLVQVGGVFIAMKAADSDGEIAEAARAITLLGGSLEQVADYAIPGTGTIRRAVIVRKTASTPKQYPRRFAKIKQTPL